MYNQQNKQVKIVLWGGTDSGKTCYLASMGIASIYLQPLFGSATREKWDILARDDMKPGSLKFLQESMDSLLKEAEFPASTEDVPEMYYTISGHPDKDTLMRMIRTFTQPLNKGISRQAAWSVYTTNQRLPSLNNSDLQFDMPVRDLKGEGYRAADYDAPLWDEIADADGIVYLWDPKPNAGTANYEYFIKGLNQVRVRALHKGTLENGKLPHFLAICISKYDELDTFKVLREKGMIAVHDYGYMVVPTVIDPRKAFEMLTYETHTDQIIPGAIGTGFQESRIEVFATSAIGFYSPDPRHIDLEDCYNISDRNGHRSIRGMIRPVNIFAPLSWIAWKAAQQRGHQVRP